MIIHIGKCGGSNINYKFKEKYKIIVPTIHCFKCTNNHIINTDHICILLRDPITRYISIFYYYYDLYKRYMNGENIPHKNEIIKQKHIFLRFNTANKLAEALNSEDLLEKNIAESSFILFKHLNYNYEYYLSNLNIDTIKKNKKIRKYDINITFENIEIRNSISSEEKQNLLKNPFIRSFGYIVKFKFNFTINNNINYDIIIHIRGTDRLQKKTTHNDFCTTAMLESYINKTIDYVNNDKSISTFTIVSDDNKYINKIKTKIKKQFIDLSYKYDINKDWLDFYYLTKPEKYIIMCSQFSSYSLCASILGNKKISAIYLLNRKRKIFIK